MKNMKRLASLVLALLMAATSVATLASCNGDKPKGGEESTVAQGSENVTVESATDEVSGDVHPEIRQKNWGEDFYLHILPDVNPPDCYWVEESKNDLMSEAVFERQQKIYEYLGIEVIGQRTGNFSEYVEPFTTAVKNKDGSVDLLISYRCRRPRFRELSHRLQQYPRRYDRGGLLESGIYGEHLDQRP